MPWTTSLIVLSALGPLFGTVTTAAAQPPDVRWARIPAGTFEMGCVSGDVECAEEERPRHRVTLTKPVDLMTTEITVGLFQTFAAANGYPMPPQPPWNGDRRAPVVNVTWVEAAAFCRSLGARLPTEAEWERAARAGKSDQIHPWRAAAPYVDGRPSANVADEAAKREHADWTTFDGYADGHAYTAPVASFAANDYGVHDMIGNVSEWVADWFEFDYYHRSPLVDSVGPPAGNGHVIRGGSWADYRQGVRLSARTVAGSMTRGLDIGARCARDVTR